MLRPANGNQQFRVARDHAFALSVKTIFRIASFCTGRPEPADANLSKPRRTHFANVEFDMPGYMLTRLVDSQRFWPQSEPLNSEKACWRISVLHRGSCPRASHLTQKNILAHLSASQRFWPQGEPLISEKHVGTLRGFTEVLGPERAFRPTQTL